MSTRLKCYELPLYFRKSSIDLLPEMYEETLGNLIKMGRMTPFEGNDFYLFSDNDKFMEVIFRRPGIYLVRRIARGFFPMAVIEDDDGFKCYHLHVEYFKKHVAKQSSVYLTKAESDALHSVWKFLTKEQKSMWIENGRRVASNRLYWKTYMFMKRS